MTETKAVTHTSMRESLLASRALRIQNAKPVCLILQSRQLCSWSQPFLAVHQGLLFATGCRRAMEVPVPLDYGVDTYRFPEDLRAYSWINIDSTQVRTTPLRTDHITEYGGRMVMVPFRGTAILLA